jgi:phage terminase small subunit
MRALNTSQRRFVLAALTFPTGKDWQIAKAAGYSDRSFGALRVCAHRLFHDEKVIAAMHEEAGKRLRSSAILGISVMAKIARTDGHRDQLKAAEALANRIGFGVEQHITVTKTDQTGAALVQRIKDVAAALGVDASTLLGANVAAPMKIVEHQPVSDLSSRSLGEG